MTSAHAAMLRVLQSHMYATDYFDLADQELQQLRRKYLPDIVKRMVLLLETTGSDNLLMQLAVTVASEEQKLYLLMNQVSTERPVVQVLVDACARAQARQMTRTA